MHRLETKLMPRVMEWLIRKSAIGEPGPSSECDGGGESRSQMAKNMLN